MRILVTYSSKTGNTKKLAEGIYNKLGEVEKSILPMKEVEDIDEYDLILVGYWVDRGMPNEEASEFMKNIKNKKVGIFATLAYWPDSEHAWESLRGGESLLKENNHIIGKYICQGAIDKKIIKVFEKMPKDNPHYPTPEKRKRYQISMNHPSSADIACAAELFRERIEQDV